MHKITFQHIKKTFNKMGVLENYTTMVLKNITEEAFGNSLVSVAGKQMKKKILINASCFQRQRSFDRSFKWL